MMALLLDTPKELETLYEFENNRRLLDSFITDYDDYTNQLVSIKTKTQAQDFADKIAPLRNLSSRWADDFPRYRLIRDDLEYVKEIQKDLDEKIKQLESEKETEKSISRSEPEEEKDIVQEKKQIIEPLTEFITVLEEIIIPQVEANFEITKQLPILEAVFENPTISLKDLDEFYETLGLVGEKSTRILQTLGAINLLSFGIESLSGSGKSYTIDFLMKLLPENAVYKMELSSKTAESYEADEINKKKIIYIPELQKALNSGNIIITEILKNITEGKDASRKVRDQANGTNKKFVIKGDKGVIFTLATENSFKYDDEFSRRVFTLSTDISAEQTAKILKSIGNQNNSSLLQRNYTTLQEHVKECIELDYVNYVNPFSEHIAELIPKTIRARSYAKYFFDLTNACTKFNFKQRTMQNNTLFVNLEDVYTINSLYGSQFIKSLLKVPLIGEEALRIFKDSKNQYSAQDIHLSLKQINPDVNFRLTTKTLDQLVDAGFLDKNDYRAKDPKYHRTQNKLDFDLGIDYNECWRIGEEFMKTNYPKIYNEWMNNQNMKTYDVLQEKEVCITENGL